MIEHVDFISRAKAEALSSQENLAIISITEPEAEPANLTLSEERILRLVFHDVDPGNEADMRWQLFDEEHAQAILDFVDRLHAAPERYTLIVHCRAEISRSAAIALFTADMTGCEFPRQPFAGLANRHLLRTLGKLSGKCVTPPRALPKKERFSVSVSRDFRSGLAQVTVINEFNQQQVVWRGRCCKYQN